MQRGHLSEIFVSIQGEGLHVGRRHLFIRFGGCNIRCRYCDTPDSLERSRTFRLHAGGRDEEHPNPTTTDAVAELLDPILYGEALDGVSFTGGEPLLQADFIGALLERVDLPRPRLLETNGMLPDKLARIVGRIDLVSMDIKLPSNSGEPAFWTEHEEFLHLARGKAYVKVLVDEGTEVGEVVRAAQLVATTAPETPVYLQPIAGPAGGFDLGRSRLELFHREARGICSDVRVLPQIHKVLAIP